MILPSRPLLDLFPGWTAGAIASELGTTRRAIERWKAGGGINEGDADRLAVAAGRNPVEVWPELVDLIVAQMRRCRTCDEILTGSPKKLYCDRSCRDRHPDNRAKASAYEREWKRRKYAENEEWRRQVLERNQEYRAEAARVLKVKQDAYRQKNADRIKAQARDRYWANPERFRAEQRVRDRAKRAAA